jgi:hypothetical protein
MPGRGPDRPWREYRLGIVVTAVTALVGISIFAVGSTCGPFRADSYTYTVAVDEAGGIRVGSLVRIGGVDVGEVTAVDIVPPQEPAARPAVPGDTLPLPAALELRPDVRLTLTVRAPYDRNITEETRAQLASIGAGGDRYVKLTPGDVREPPLPHGAIIPTVASVDLDLVLSRLSRAFNEMVEISLLTDEIRAKVSARRGSLGLLAEPDAELLRQVDALQREALALMDLLDHGPGFIGLYRNDLELQARVDSVGADVRAIRAAMADPGGAYRAYTDPVELREALRGLRGEIASLDARLAEGRGSLGRFQHDPELYIQLRILQERIAALGAAFRANPLGSVNIQIF